MLLLWAAPLQERAYNKNYMYAENTKSWFLKFPTDKTFDHRKL